MKHKQHNVGMTWGRTFINVMVITVLIAIIVIIVLIGIYYKQIFTKAVQATVDAVNDNRGNIQPSIDKFAITTTNNTLKTPSVRLNIKDIVDESTEEVLQKLQKDVSEINHKLDNLQPHS